MEREAAKFKDHAEAERATRLYYRGLTPEQRLDILLELIERHAGHASSKGLERVYRIVKRPRR
jgi:hypothetical protein